VFYDTSVKEMAADMDAGKTLAVCFGSADCSWCREAMPLINDAAENAGFEVGYIDTRKNPEWKSNMDIDDYDLLVERVGEYLGFDQEGLRHLYTPSLFVFRFGKVVGYHEGTVETHNANVREMSQEEKLALREIYRDMFDVMKNGKDDGKTPQS
jgi:thiol-disulfide isomerase/thioredoxin